MAQLELLQGGCLCGAIRYQVNGLPFDADHCHCSQCRKSAGAVMISWMDFVMNKFNGYKGKSQSLLHQRIFVGVFVNTVVAH